MVEPVAHLCRERIVVRADAAEDVRCGAQIRVGPRTFEKSGRVRGRSDRPARADRVSHRPCVGLADVRIHKVRQASAKTAEIAHGDHGIPPYFSFDGQVRLLNLWRLEVWIKINYAQSAAWRRRRGGIDNLREWRRAGIGCA